ncbi:MAG: glycosyltransferase family 1 protein [Acidobacteria bacterium]|nr:MAG: glycosyltransferase family 1 protein [Acidobacteriota bacterium]
MQASQMKAVPDLVFVSGTAANVRQGSGTFVGIAALQASLRALGSRVELVAPAAASPSAWRRLAFNWRLRGQAWPEGAAVIGFDWDGLFVPRSRIACIKGVLAEEMQFEHGVPRVRLWMQSRLERRRVRQAHRVLTTSRYAAAAIERRYGVPADRIRVVAEMLDVGAWERELEQAPVVPDRPLTILCVAHLYPRKDVGTLLRATSRLPESVRLRIVGDGPERKRLERMGGRASFLGHIPRAALLQEYRNADVFCLPSRQEGFGIVLLESMASGLPIVAARAAAIPEVVAEGTNALLFAPGDPGELADALQRLLADARLREQMAAASRRHVRKFEAAVVAEQFLAAISAG